MQKRRPRTAESREPDAHRAQFLWTFFVCMLVAAAALYQSVRNPGHGNSLLEETTELSSSDQGPSAAASTGQLVPLSKIRSTAAESK